MHHIYWPLFWTWCLSHLFWTLVKPISTQFKWQEGDSSPARVSYYTNWPTAPESALHAHYMHTERLHILTEINQNGFLTEYSDILRGTNLINAFWEGCIREDDIALLFSIDGTHLYAYMLRRVLLVESTYGSSFTSYQLGTTRSTSLLVNSFLGWIIWGTQTLSCFLDCNIWPVCKKKNLRYGMLLFDMKSIPRSFWPCLLLMAHV